MIKIPKLLSKTRLMKGYRCAKAIYLNISSPDLEAPVTPELQALFDQGNAVGVEARSRFPGGELVDCKPWDFIGSLKRTRELLSLHTETIYEAAFEYNGCYARADIIKHNRDTKRWTIYEVKSSTKVKPEQVDDVGLQAWIMANSGLPIEKIFVLHLNPECKFPNLENLFVEADVTDLLREKYPGISPKIRDIFSVLRGSGPPETDIGPHCLSPNECGFKDACWTEKKIPQISIFSLPQVRDKKWDLYSQGIVEITDPRLSDLTPLQERVVRVHSTGRRYVDKTGIKSALKSWKFPLVFLDFETIGPAIPRYKGARPFAQVPFQFSVHVCDSWKSEVIHYEYLHDDNQDPRPKLIPALIRACESGRSVVAYYAQFEASRIQEMAECFPEYKQQLDAISERIVDPLPVIREHVYDAKFAGSFSLKAVAPALLGESFSYEGMQVGDGTAAQRAFEELISGDADPERKRQLTTSLLEYCKKDTFVMVELVKWLFTESEVQ